jgi:prepilin signal peptidase PulO-like enzyme (type II secretory pathway)
MDNHFLIYVVLILVGLCMGSFAGAMVWRLRARQLVQDKALGEKVDSKEYKQLLPLTKVSPTADRSRCLHCGHMLAWYDLLPLVSWVVTAGKCRYCHVRIGLLEPLMELGVAVFFVGSYLLWPDALGNTAQVAHFLLWLIAGVLMAILFAYDVKWYLLPNYIVFSLIAVSGLIAVIQVVTSLDVVTALLNIVIAAVILSGLYYLLWLVSKGQWIGLGDVKLGLALALLLGDWQLAFIALFAANLVGCLVVIPGMLAKKITRKSHVPFGPLLIIGGVGAVLGGQYILNWYFSSLL